MDKLQQKTVLLAPTGRAAKVLAAYSGFAAYTVHKRIYRQKSIGEDRFSLSYNSAQDTTFIVDEASMIANIGSETNNFGTGRLLDDLIQYVFSGHNCSLILIGDDAQLPPIGQTDSPALNTEWLQGYGLNVHSYTLIQVARQALESGILKNATMLRERLTQGDTSELPVFDTQGFNDICLRSGQDLTEDIEQAYREAGIEETIIVTRSNRRMNMYNQAVRARILWKEEELTGGDRLMVTKNNYFWTRHYEGIEFLANGDIVQVLRLRNTREIYGYRFADASLRAIDYDWEIDAVVWLDTLFTLSPEDNYLMQKTLFTRITEDYPEISSKKKLTETIMQTPYYNALHVKHAYAVTCHKAQGGQWKRVFIDQAGIKEEQADADYYRWLYTAITRATEKVFIIS